MPTNYTPNYQLSQWEPGDAVKRVDFNEDNAKIDAAIKAAEQRIDSLSSTVSSHTSSLSGHTASISRLGSCAVLAVPYTGDGSASKTLSFAGYPVYVHVRGVDGSGYLSFLRGTDNPLGSFSTGNFPTSWGSRSITWSSPSANGSFNTANGQYVALVLLDMSK